MSDEISTASPVPERDAQPTPTESVADSPPVDQPTPDKAPLRSVHTHSFPQLLAQLRSSLMVTTYQAGKLVMLRNDNGVLNTHFRVFNKPMGLAIADGRLAIGTATSIQEYRNIPAAAPKVSAEKTHDAAWLPRRENVTGDVQIHEMA